jgi:hypothetical protein
VGCDGDRDGGALLGRDPRDPRARLVGRDGALSQNLRLPAR